MRRSFAIVLAAGGRWPDAQTGGITFPFNWVSIDNRGSNPVDVSFAANPAAGDVNSTYLTVGAGKVRTFNVGGPRSEQDKTQENWPDQIYLVSALGTNLTLDIADHPIVDMVFAT
jgi:hypothetical protein